MSYGSRSFEEASGEGRKTSLDGRSHWSKYDHATALAAALAYITLRQGDRAGLMVFADEVRAFVRRSSSQGTWRQIVGALSLHPLGPGNAHRPTEFARAVEQTLAKLTNRCLIAVISDFFTDPEKLRDALARLRFRGHDTMLFQVLDRQETRFDFADAAPFEGLEGESAIRVNPRALRESYLDAINAHNAAIEKIARSFGFDYQRLGTHDWLGPPLASFVARRNAMLKRSKPA
jgi:uncharacterized protein (DUF58 family)